MNSTNDSDQKYSKRETSRRMKVALRAAFKMPQATRSERNKSQDKKYRPKKDS
jgi:hypothetical protein